MPSEDQAREERIVVQNVNAPGYTTRVNAGMYRAMREAMLEILPTTEPGLTQAEILEAVIPHLPEALYPAGAKAPWWAKTVQLDLEAKGILARDATRSLRWHRIEGAQLPPDPPIERTVIPLNKDYLYFPDNTSVGEVLRAYTDRERQWWWLLVTEREGEYYVCSFGSLLPYLTGRTPHIVHSIGDCPICSGMEPVLWQDTAALVEEALADAGTSARAVSDLPMATLPVIEAKGIDRSGFYSWLVTQRSRVCGVTENGTFSGVYVEQVKGALGGPPEF